MSKDKYIVYFISRTKQKMTQFIQSQLRKQQLDELIPSHGNILTVLYENGDRMPLSEIAKRIGRDKSTVTPLVNKLAGLGYVERVAGQQDKRVTFVQLTRQGHELKPRFEQISAQVYETAYRGFSPEEKEQFLSLLKRINQNFSQSDSEADEFSCHDQ